jgi:voltage-gated sodium channel
MSAVSPKRTKEMSMIDHAARAPDGDFFDRRWVQVTVMTLIAFNAVVLGLEQIQALASWKPTLVAIDRILLAVFCVELVAKMAVRRLAFWRDSWNWFDVMVIAIALVPSSGPLAVLRALRVLRVLRLISAVPAMRLVVETVLRSLPGLGAILAVQGLIIYSFAVMGSALFGKTDPEHFGGLFPSLFTLFQVMTLEDWAGIARGLLTEYPGAWLYFISFILASTFVVLNLFIAVIGNSMQELRGEQETKEPLVDEIRALRSEVAALASHIKNTQK